jgi:hypothetical protein
LCFFFYPPNGAIIEHSAYDIAQQLTNRVERICASTGASTADTTSPLITKRIISEPLSHFKPVTSDKVIKMLKAVQVKQCTFDPVKKLINEFAPIIANLCNVSVDQCALLVDQMRAIMRPLLKKPSLDMSELNKYRPVSNFQLRV